MRWVLAWHGEDGPTQDLMSQVDFGQHWPESARAADPGTLRAILAAHPRPVAVFMIAPQSSEQWDWPHGAQRLRDLILDVCQRADAVVLAITEIDVLQQYLRDLTQVPNLWIMAPAQHNYGGDHRPFVIWQHWIQDLRDTWQQGDTRQRLEQIDPVSSSSCLFDVLLGGERPYRTRLHDLIESDTVLRDRVVMSYFGVSTTRPGFIPEPDMQDCCWPDPMHTGIRVRYRGTEQRLACVPPVSIYQRTLITVLAETSAHGVMNFYTEKVAKPLLAGRPFLAIGGQHYLRGLRDSGFLTFAPIIDESYDLESRDDARVDMVFRELQRLNQQDPLELLRQLQHQVQHNRELAWQRDFTASAVYNVQQLAERHWKHRA